MGAKITGPSRKAVPCTVEPGLSPENSLVRFIPREEGPYQVEVTYDGVPVPGSPFPVEAVPPTDPSKVGLTPCDGALWVWGGPDGVGGLGTIPLGPAGLALGWGPPV